VDPKKKIVNAFEAFYWRGMLKIKWRGE